MPYAHPFVCLHSLQTNKQLHVLVCHQLLHEPEIGSHGRSGCSEVYEGIVQSEIGKADHVGQYHGRTPRNASSAMN